MRIRRILHAATLLLLIACISFLADAVYSYRSYRKASSMDLLPAPLSPPSVLVRKEANDYSVIPRRDLFTAAPLGRADRPVASPPVPPPPAPTRPGRNAASRSSQVPAFRLVGTTVFPGGGGYAILESIGSKEQTIHREGDRVQGAVIQEVKRGEVRLLRNGGVEVLRAFEGEKDEIPPPSLSTRGPRSLPSAQMPPPPVPVVRQESRRSQLKPFLGSQEEFRHQLRAEKYTHRDGEAGVRLNPLAGGELLLLLGLQSGDVVFSVDGIPVKEGGEFFRGLSRMLAAGKVETEMKILRDGRKLALSLHLRQ